MNNTIDRAEYAENIVDRLNEVLYCAQSAIEELEGVDNSACLDISMLLSSIVEIAEAEKKNCSDVFAEIDMLERAAMNHEYERSVL